MKNTKPLHIAIIADPLQKQDSGVFQYTFNLVKQFARLKNHKVSIVLLKKDYTTDKEPATCNPQPATIYYLPNTLKFLKDDPIRTFVTLPRLIKKLSPDIVIEPAHFGPFNLPRRIKRVTVIHDLTPIKFPRFHRFQSQFLQRIFLPGILKRADLIVTNSENTKKDVIAYSPQAKEKTTFIHLGKDEFFKPERDISVLRKYGVKQPYFLFVGTIEPRKNLITLLEAFEQFKQKNQTNHALVIVGGKGWKSGRFFKKLKQYPFRSEIIIPGYVLREELPVFYSMAESFIYPSIYEGFGFPVLEAMACGTPVITSKTSSLPEVGGEAAVYFDPYQVSELVEKMELLEESDNMRKEMINKGFQQAEKFSWKKYAKEFVNLLEMKFGRSE